LLTHFQNIRQKVLIQDVYNAKQNTNGPQKGKEMLFSLSVILLFWKPFCISQQMRFWTALKGLLWGLRKRRVGIPSDSGPTVRVSGTNRPSCAAKDLSQPPADSSPTVHGTNIKKRKKGSTGPDKNLS